MLKGYLADINETFVKDLNLEENADSFFINEINLHRNGIRNIEATIEVSDEDHIDAADTAIIIQEKLSKFEGVRHPERIEAQYEGIDEGEHYFVIRFSFQYLGAKDEKI